MRELWVEIERSMPKDLKKRLLEASENLSAVLASNSEDVSLARSSGIRVASPVEGDIQIIDESEMGQIEKLKTAQRPLGLRLTVKNREDEAKAIRAIERGIDYVIVSCPDWVVIPLENLIAKAYGRVKLLAEVTNSQEAKVALEALELGVDGVVLKTTDVKEVELTSKVLEATKTRVGEAEAVQRVELTAAKVTAIRQLGMGARACIATCDIMTHGEGMLVGPQSSVLFLIQAEVQETPYIEPRPFRVNAGPVSLYVLAPGNKTRYLSELKAGDEVLAVDREGRFRTVVVGRVKIERRPMTLVEAEVDGYEAKTIVQNAETIRFVTREGSKSVVELKPEDEVLVHYQPGGRHFGLLVSEESVIER